MTNDQRINVAGDFSKYPGGRFRSDGEYSGERFRQEYLAPALKNHDKIIVELDGTLGYGSSFLEEAFGGLVRTEGFTPDHVSRTLDLRSNNDTLLYTIKHYIQQARMLEATHR